MLPSYIRDGSFWHFDKEKTLPELAAISLLFFSPQSQGSWKKRQHPLSFSNHRSDARRKPTSSQREMLQAGLPLQAVLNSIHVRPEILLQMFPLGPVLPHHTPTGLEKRERRRVRLWFPSSAVPLLRGASPPKPTPDKMKKKMPQTSTMFY